MPSRPNDKHKPHDENRIHTWTELGMLWSLGRRLGLDGWLVGAFFANVVDCPNSKSPMIVDSDGRKCQRSVNQSIRAPRISSNDCHCDSE